ncbi:MFS general substrate transporter [Dactylonectria macrodidyma]|uniref:MFS general substrate transporter n=1 Tax=Dactylonectria macrodidyma TaxID=307937 RepID=A0A9P9DK06_9HYPO|nr:MFS general substrate transporter [Dactylonectria macrodidyma]
MKSSPTALEGGDEEPNVPHWRIVHDPILLTPAVVSHDWMGSGTEEDPYYIGFIPNDQRNPLNFGLGIRWMIAGLNALATLAMTFSSSAYTGAISDISQRLSVGSETAFLGVSLFVLGFALGPLLWAPLSETLGRRIVFTTSYGAFVACNLVATVAPNMPLLATSRLLAGAFGSSALVLSGSIVVDLFSPADRGRVSAVFSAAPFLGPVLGPIAGGFLGEAAGWAGVGTMITAVTGLVWLLYYFLVPETYAPVLLRLRAAALTRDNQQRGTVFLAQMDRVRAGSSGGRKSVGAVLRTAMTRPWALLFSEIIVIVLSTYMAVIFGTMYMMFAAFPIVFQGDYGLRQGVAGLAFLGIAAGMVAALVFMLFQNRAYVREAKASPTGRLAPEMRLRPAQFGAIMAPLGLLLFALTNSPEFHVVLPVAGTAPFGFGMVVIFLSLLNYIIDTYTVYAGSAIAASTLLRSLFGAVFPLFTKVMFERLGVHYGAGVPAILALLCVPCPFVMRRYGEGIRERARFAQEARGIALRMAGGAADEKKEQPYSETSEPAAPGTGHGCY